jgi:hypothetical protein
MDEIIFEVRDDPECGLRARALGYSIFTQGADLTELQDMLRDAVRLYFKDENERPRVIRLHYVQEVVIAA